jgi:hypothetical protein
MIVSLLSLGSRCSLAASSKNVRPYLPRGNSNSAMDTSHFRPLVLTLTNSGNGRTRGIRMVVERRKDRLIERKRRRCGERGAQPGERLREGIGQVSDPSHVRVVRERFVSPPHPLVVSAHDSS